MKRRLILLAAFIAVSLLSGLISPKPIQAASKCTGGGTVPPGVGGTVAGSYPASAVAGDTVTVTVTWSGGGSLHLSLLGGPAVINATGTSPLSASVTLLFVPTGFAITDPTDTGGQVVTYSISVNGGGCDDASEGDDVTFLEFDDGRINSHDGAETAAVYCEDDGGVTIFSVVNSVGKLAFTVSADEMDELPDHPEHNTLIKSGSGISLYELTTGELQINAPDKYVFIWDGCSA